MGENPLKKKRFRLNYEQPGFSGKVEIYRPTVVSPTLSAMNKNLKFWQKLDELVKFSPIKIDRPKGSAHPRFPNFVYPLDYDYLEGTGARDGSGLDVWVGSQSVKKVTGIVCNVDLLKKGSEIKLLIGCNEEEMEKIIKLHNVGDQSGILIKRNS